MKAQHEKAAAPAKGAAMKGAMKATRNHAGDEGKGSRPSQERSAEGLHHHVHHHHHHHHHVHHHHHYHKTTWTRRKLAEIEAGAEKEVEGAEMESEEEEQEDIETEELEKDEEGEFNKWGVWVPRQPR